MPKIAKTKHDCRISGSARLRNKKYPGNLFVDGSLDCKDIDANKIRINGSAKGKNIKANILKINGSADIKSAIIDMISIQGSSHMHSIQAKNIYTEGASILDNIEAHEIEIKASANISNSKTKNLRMYGSLSGTNLGVENNIVIHAGGLIQDSRCNNIEAHGTLILIDTKVSGQITIGESLSMQKQIVKLKGNTVVHDITFDGEGEVHIFGGAQIMGRVTNGTVITKTSPKLSNSNVITKTEVHELSSEVQGISRVE
jgi:hypothetical protein